MEKEKSEEKVIHRLAERRKRLVEWRYIAIKLKGALEKQEEKKWEKREFGKKHRG